VRWVALLLLNLAASPALAFAPTRTEAPPPVVRAARPAPARLTISDDGKSVFLNGAIESGMAMKFQAVLEAAPDVRTIVLQSEGGRLGEAIDISEIVRAKGLDTYVESWCHSACTIILLAGRDRAAAPSARIGFHEPAFPGAKAADIPSLRSVSRRIYDNAGVQPTFTDRAFATPTSGMWFPTVEELQSARVLTRISLSGETMAGASQLKSREDIVTSFAGIPFWPALKTRYPDVADAMVEESWRAKQAGGNDNEIASAGRAVLIKNYHKMLATASDELLAEYLDLVIDQADAARALSFDACDKAFKGQLNIYLTLPKALSDREIALVSSMLASSETVARKPVGSLETLFEPIFRRLPVDQLQAVAATDDNYSRPAAQRAAITQSLFLTE
jgi:hypothetical protein